MRDSKSPHAADAGTGVAAIFSYGTLRDTAVQRSVFGRELVMTTDRLPGYRLDWLVVTDPDVVAASGTSRHPILRSGTADDVIDGVRLDVTESDLALADRYEVSDYTRVAVLLASGHPAWVYVAVDPS